MFVSLTACLPAEQAELEDLMKQWILRRTKAVIASQLPKKGEVLSELSTMSTPVFRLPFFCLLK